MKYIAFSVAAFLATAALAGGDLTAAIAPTASANNTSVGLHVSTLGIGPDVSYRLNPYVKVGISGNYFSITRKKTVEFQRVQGGNFDVSVDLKGTLRMFTAGATVDVHPFGGDFYIRGGLFYNGNEGRISASLKNLTVYWNNTSYNFNNFGAAKGKLYFNRVAPYIGTGYSFGSETLTLSFEGGVLFQGKVKAKVTSLTGLVGGTQQAAIRDGEIEIANRVNKKTKLLRFYPVVSIGINYKF